MAEATIDPLLADTGPIRADLGQILARSAARFGAKPALVAAGQTFTYRQLHELSDRVAGGLRELGVRPGDRVSLYSPNRWEWVVAYHAALRAGAVVNPINVMLTPEEVAFVLNDCGAAAVFTSGEKAEVIVGAEPAARRAAVPDRGFPGACGAAGAAWPSSACAAPPVLPGPDDRCW